MSYDIFARVRNSPCPTALVRTQRFAQCDVVDVVAGPGPRSLGHRVLEVVLDPMGMDAKDFAHCGGSSARYRLSGLDPASDWGGGWRWDFELCRQGGAS